MLRVHAETNELTLSQVFVVAGTEIFVQGDYSAGGLGTEVPRWVQGRSSGRRSGRLRLPEAEAVCRYCLQILTAETIKIWKFRTIHLLILNQYAVWFKLTVTLTEMTINWNKSNPVTVTVTEIPVTETFS